MSGATAVILSSKAPLRPRCRNQIPAYDPKRLGLWLNQTKCDGKSEYQTSYTKWPFQKPRTNIIPESNHLEIPPTLCDMDMETTYKTDYVPHEAKKRESMKEPTAYRQVGGTMLSDTTYKVDFAPKVALRTESFKIHRQYNAPVTKFSGKSIYQMSYRSTDPEVAKQCRQSPIRPSECIRGEEKLRNRATPASTFRNDYQKHENTEKRVAIKPKENNQLSKEPLEDTTSYKHFYTKKDLPPHAKKVLNTNIVVTKKMLPESLRPTEEDASGDGATDQPSPEIQETKSVVPVTTPSPPPGMMTTFTADFRPHYNVRRRTNCKPPESGYHFIDAPFDGKTTKGMAYKVWPVAFPEKPQWARKPEYKRPQTMMYLDSTYAADFKHPGNTSPPLPIKLKHNQDIIRHVASGDAGAETTYQNSFKGMNLQEPTKSFLVKQVYVPPTEKMICQSTQRAHYTGEHSVRANLCRQVSEHRSLYKDNTMEFNTTYKDTYRDNRPKSCPVSVALMRGSTKYTTDTKTSNQPQSGDSNATETDNTEGAKETKPEE